MTDYTKTTNFTAKDSLTTGDPNKVVSGAEIDAEFDALATASASKVDDGANSTLTSLTGLTTPLTVAQGGSGAATLTDGGVLLGSGTGAVTAMAVLADGEMIVGDGTTDPVAESGLTLLQSIGVDNLVDKNPIINGDFNSWQEGEAHLVEVGNGSASPHFADMFTFIENGTPASTWTITQDTSVPTVAESGHLSTSSMKAVCVSDSTGDSGTDGIGIRYTIEGYDFLPYAQQIFTISFWHKHTKTGTQSVVLQNSGNDTSYVAEYTQTTTNTWEKATLTIPASPSAGTWDYTNSAGLKIIWGITAQSSRTFAATGSWVAGGSSIQYASDDSVDNADAASNVFQLAQIKIDKGAVALPFIGRSHQEELSRIHRYFRRMTESTGNYQLASGLYTSTTAFRAFFEFPVEMRAAPTMGDSGDTDFSVQSNLQETVASGFAIANAYPTSAIITMTTSTAVDGDGGILFLESASDGGYLEFDARL
tara:strand:- start:98 stop:1534 length:1437 start_codon:yes stop_codon:yes gene_type:complete